MGEQHEVMDLAAQSRRDFLAGTGFAASAAALAAAFGSSDAFPAEKTRCAATNALLPTGGQMQHFLALPDDQPIVMVNLLKFKPQGGEAEYAKYVAGIQPILEKLGAKSSSRVGRSFV